MDKRTKEYKELKERLAKARAAKAKNAAPAKPQLKKTAAGTAGADEDKECKNVRCKIVRFYGSILSGNVSFILRRALINASIVSLLRSKQITSPSTCICI